MVIRKYLLATCVLVAAPSLVHATGLVRINEIAWMGTKVSASAEWMELFNNSSTSVELDGWTLTTADGTPDIHFSTKDSIAPHGYFLLERTRNGVVPGVTADKIYTGSLKNSGETLILTNNASTTIDNVIGGKNWCAVGGNNTTKQTAQYSGGGWITATGTPRATNATVGTVASCAKVQSYSDAGGAGVAVTTSAASTTASTTTQTSASTTSSTASSGTTETSSTVVHHSDGAPQFAPVPPVFLSIGPDKEIVAGADVRFNALATNRKGKQYTSATVYWAFGDGSKATGTSVFKSYRAPGAYAVVANAIQGLGSGEDDMIVTVHNAHVLIPTISKQGITVRNDTPYRLDMSFWRLQAGTTTFAFPEHTTILPHTSVLFPKEITKLPFTSDTVLLYPNGKQAARYAFVARDAKYVATETHTKPFVSSARYNTVRGSDKGVARTHSVAPQKDSIYQRNVISAYDNKTLIAPAVAIKIATAGAPVARAFISYAPSRASKSASSSFITSTTNTSSPSFTHRFIASPWTLPLLFILISSTVIFILL